LRLRQERPSSSPRFQPWVLGKIALTAPVRGGGSDDSDANEKRDLGWKLRIALILI
jgi:hypothetical protein